MTSFLIVFLFNVIMLMLSGSQEEYLKLFTRKHNGYDAIFMWVYSIWGIFWLVLDVTLYLLSPTYRS